MAGFVAGQNQFALLANAFTGAAKGASDFASLKLKRDQIDESARQFDENLEFGFTKLDEQIRQFDVGTSERARMESARNDLKKKLTREGFVSAQRQSTIAAGPGHGRNLEAKKLREFKQRLADREHTSTTTIDAMEKLGVAAHWNDWTKYQEDFKEGTVTGEFDWNTRADQMARDLAADQKPSGEPVTEEDIRIRRQQIDNYRSLKTTHNENLMNTAKAAAAARAARMRVSPDEYIDTGEPAAVGYSRIMFDAEGTPMELPDSGWTTKEIGRLGALEANDPSRRGATQSFRRMEGASTRLSQATSVGAADAIEQSMLELRELNIDNLPGLTGQEIAEYKRAFIAENAKHEALYTARNQPGKPKLRVENTTLAAYAAAQQQQRQAERSGGSPGTPTDTSAAEAQRNKLQGTDNQENVFQRSLRGPGLPTLDQGSGGNGSDIIDDALHILGLGD